MDSIRVDHLPKYHLLEFDLRELDLKTGWIKITVEAAVRILEKCYER